VLSLLSPLSPGVGVSRLTPDLQAHPSPKGEGEVLSLLSPLSPGVGVRRLTPRPTGTPLS
jgi:hypothetical protein